MVVYASCDASFCPGKGVAAWAGHIASERGTYSDAGSFVKIRKRSIQEAECHAIANVVWLAVTTELCLPGDYLIINSDARQVLNMYREKRYEMFAALHTDAIEYVWDVVEWNELTLELRHIKAHTGRRDARSRANEWCDETARSYMQRLRRWTPRRTERVGIF